MERRLFIAIGLSLLVVWLWSGMTQKKRSVKTGATRPQHYDIKKVKESEATIPPPSSGIESVSEKNDPREKIEILDSMLPEDNMAGGRSR